MSSFNWPSPPGGGGGAGTVTTVSVVTANGFSGTISNPTTTPAITISTTITGIIKGDGTAISAAIPGTDYQPAGNYITALTGDVTASGPGSAASTLATVNTNTGSFGSSTAIPNFTANAKGLMTAAGTNAVIAPAGTLTGSTLASGVTASSLTSVGTQAQALNMGSHKITAVTDPSSAQDAATKAYVDAAVAALNPAAAVYAATTVNITGTYLNGVAGVGATFTITATGAFTLDGTTPPAGSRILVKNQSTGFQNGIYDLTVAGTIGVSPVLTRSLDYNTASDINSAGLIPVINGTANALSSWQQVSTITTVGTDALVFTEFTANPSLYLLKANNLSDVSNRQTSLNTLAGAVTSANFLRGDGSNVSMSAIQAADVPTLNQNTSGSAASLSATLAIGSGGTGQTTKAPAFNALSPMTTGGDLIYGGTSGVGTRLGNGNASQFLRSAGGTAAPTWGTVMTNWVAYTPTITGLGTVTNLSAFWRQVGDSYEVKAYFTSGTAAAALASLTLPSGNIDTAKMTIAVTTGGDGENIGNYGCSATASAGYMVACTSTSTSIVYFALNWFNQNTLRPGNGNAIGGSTADYSLKFSVPISGLSI